MKKKKTNPIPTLAVLALITIFCFPGIVKGTRNTEPSVPEETFPVETESSQPTESRRQPLQPFRRRRRIPPRRQPFQLSRRRPPLPPLLPPNPSFSFPPSRRMGILTTLCSSEIPGQLD